MAAADSANAVRLGISTPPAPSFMPQDASLPVPQQTAQDTYYTAKVGTTGMTQAQLDAQANAIATAKLIGGTTVPNPAGGLTVVPPTPGAGTGFVPPPPAPGGAGATPTNSIDVLKAMLRGMGFNSAIIDSSSTYLNKLLGEGFDYDNAVQLFLNTKDYTLKDGTTVTSPFYTQYGFLNEGLVNPKTASELYNAVEGYKGIVDKYALSTKFLTPESLKGYVKNNISVAALDERANMARLKAVSADTAQVNALVKLGYINSAADLTDFYLDSKIGQEQLNQNRITGAFAAEAVRRAQTGIQFNRERMTQLGAEFTSRGLSESQAGALAAQGYETIGEQLNPMSKFAGIYDKAQETAALKTSIQTELENEQFMGTASQKRKLYTELEQRAFQGQSGRYSGKTSTAGIL